MPVEQRVVRLDTYRIIHAGSNHVLGVRDGSMQDLAELVESDDNGGPDHQWWADLHGKDLTLQNDNSRLFASKHPTAKDVLVVQAKAVEDRGEKWQLESIVEEEGTYRIMNVPDQTFISVQESADKKHKKLVLLPRTTDLNQKWKLGLVRTIVVTVVAGPRVAPTVWCNPPIANVPHGQPNVQLRFVLNQVGTSDWGFSPNTPSGIGIEIKNPGTDFKYKYVHDGLVLVLDDNKTTSHYYYSIHLLNKRDHRTLCYDPSIENRSDG